MNGYIGFFNSKQHDFYAETKLAALNLAIAHFKPAKSKRHLVHVSLCELNASPGQPVEQVIHRAVD